MSKHEINTYIKSYFNNEWKEYIETYPKARTYRTFKERVTPEDYLVSIRNRKSRVAMTKFRLSDHNLMIEKGRHSGMAEEKRFCPFCEDTVESECHFLLVCKLHNKNHLINAGLNVAPARPVKLANK